jgi:hypothetical protein
MRFHCVSETSLMQLEYPDFVRGVNPFDESVPPSKATHGRIWEFADRSVREPMDMRIRFASLTVLEFSWFKLARCLEGLWF